MTEKLFYEDSHRTEFTAKVISCEEAKDGFCVVLDQTAFFPEGGGQYADTGILGNTEVTDVHEKNDVIFHSVTAPLEVGSIVSGKINWKERFEKMQQHTGEHIVSGIVHERFGYNNVGFHLGADYCTMDFDGPISKAQLKEIEAAANEAVYRNLEVEVLYPSKEELKDMDYRSKIEIDGQVRIVWVPGYDRCACCATHVGSTGEIGQIKVIAMMNYKGGVRVTMVSGDRALLDHEKRERDMKEISAMLSAKEDELPEAVRRLMEENEDRKCQIIELQKRMNELKVQQIPEDSRYQCLFETNLNQNGMRDLMNKVLERGVPICGVFLKRGEQYQYVIGSRDRDIRELGKKLNVRFHGRGGGKPAMIQGSLTGEEKTIKAYFEEIINVQ